MDTCADCREGDGSTDANCRSGRHTHSDSESDRYADTDLDTKPNPHSVVHTVTESVANANCHPDSAAFANHYSNSGSNSRADEHTYCNARYPLFHSNGYTVADNGTVSPHQPLLPLPRRIRMPPYQSCSTFRMVSRSHNLMPLSGVYAPSSRTPRSWNFRRWMSPCI